MRATWTLPDVIRPFFSQKMCSTWPRSALTFELIMLALLVSLWAISRIFASSVTETPCDVATSSRMTQTETSRTPYMKNHQLYGISS